MRKLFFALALIAASVQDAASQCGYSFATGGGLASACGIAADDGIPNCWLRSGASSLTPPNYAVSKLTKSHYVLGTAPYFKESTTIGWTKQSDSSIGVANGQIGWECYPTGECAGGSRVGQRCLPSLGGQCPGSTCTDNLANRCLGGPDVGTTCAVNADCTEDFVSSIPTGDTYNDLALFASALGCAAGSAGIGCWGPLSSTLTGGGVCYNRDSRSSYYSNGVACTVESDCDAGLGDTYGRCWLGVGPSAGTYTQVDSSYGDFCGLKSDGSIDCWGVYRPALAGGVPFDPVPSSGSAPSIYSTEPAATDFIQVEVTDDYACGLHSDNTIECWGSDSRNLFLGDTTPPAGTFDSIALTLGLGCGLKADGSLSCWGDTEWFEPFLSRFCDITAIEGTDDDFCMTDPYGRVDCFYAGIGNESCPVGDRELCPSPREFQDVSLGENLVCARDSQDRLACASKFGLATPRRILYAPASAPSYTESLVVDAPSTATVPAPEGHHGNLDHHGILNSDGSVFVWGGVSDPYNLISAAPATTGNLELAFEYSSACMVASNNTLSCWGTGVGFYDEPAPGGTISNLGGSSNGTICGITSGGGLACWGTDWGDGLFTEPACTTCDQVSTSGPHGCAHRTDNSLLCWGSDFYGEGQVPAGTWSSVATVFGTTCGLKTDGSIQCWGDDFYGQQSGSPSGSNWTAIAGNGGTFCAVNSDANVYCWGFDQAWIYSGPSPNWFPRESWPDLPLTLAQQVIVMGGL